MIPLGNALIALVIVFALGLGTGGWLERSVRLRVDRAMRYPPRPHPRAKRNETDSAWTLGTVVWPDPPTEAPVGPAPRPVGKQHRTSPPEGTVKPPPPPAPPPKRSEYLREDHYRADLKAYLETGERKKFWPETTVYSDTPILEHQARMMFELGEQERREARQSEAYRVKRDLRANAVLRAVRFGLGTKDQADLHAAFVERETYLKNLIGSSDRMTAEMYQGMLERETENYLDAQAATFEDVLPGRVGDPFSSLCIPNEPPEAEAYAIEYDSGDAIPITRAEFYATPPYPRCGSPFDEPLPRPNPPTTGHREAV